MQVIFQSSHVIESPVLVECGFAQCSGTVTQYQMVWIVQYLYIFYHVQFLKLCELHQLFERRPHMDISNQFHNFTEKWSLSNLTEIINRFILGKSVCQSKFTWWNIPDSFENMLIHIRLNQQFQYARLGKLSPLKTKGLELVDLSFIRLSFSFVNYFLCCAATFYFDVVPRVDFCFCFPCLKRHVVLVFSPRVFIVSYKSHI